LGRARRSRTELPEPGPGPGVVSARPRRRCPGPDRLRCRRLPGRPDQGCSDTAIA